MLIGSSGFASRLYVVQMAINRRRIKECNIFKVEVSICLRGCNSVAQVSSRLVTVGKSSLHMLQLHDHPVFVVYELFRCQKNHNYDQGKQQCLELLPFI